MKAPPSRLALSPKKLELLELLRRERGLRGGDGPIPRRPLDAPTALSSSQERLWFLEQLVGPSPAYNVPIALRARGRLDTTALRNALQLVVDRHEVLRIAILSERGRPRVEVSPPGSAPFSSVDLSREPDPGGAPLDREIEAEASLPFDLTKGGLVRARLVRLGPDDHALLLTMHHIVSDGWSLGVLVRELGVAYAAFTSDRVPELPELPLQFADYAAWERSDRGDGVRAGVDFFVEALRDAPRVLDLPTDRPRPPVQTSRGARHVEPLSEESGAAVQALARDTGATRFVVLFAAFLGLLSRWSRQRDLVVATPVANRARPEREPLIGFFANSLPLRVSREQSCSFRELVTRTREVWLAAFAHQHTPFEAVVERLGVARDMSRSPVFQVLFALQNAPIPRLELPGLELSVLDVEPPGSKLDLALAISDDSGGARAHVQYNPDLFDRETIASLAKQYARFVAEATRAPDLAVERVPLLDPVERAALTTGALAVGAPSIRSEGDGARAFRPVHARIEAISRRAPGAIAIASGGLELSYADLWAAVERLGGALGAASVSRGDVVGVCLPRGPERVIALLAAMKAGAAYLPLDPTYPRERLAFMVRDAKAVRLVSTRALALELDLGPPVTLVDEAGAPVRSPDLVPADRAYVIHTSGSTGTPKGVAITHGGLANLVDAQIDAFDIGPTSRVLQFAAFGFDASVSEIFTALAAGATLVVDAENAALSGEGIVGALRRERVTTVTLPPSLLAVVEPGPMPDLRTLVVAGERCSAAVVRRWSAPSRRLINAYGPTEVTVCATLGVAADDGRDPSIGRPMAQMRAYVLDDLLEPVPVGVPGALWIGGAGLAEGYLGRPDSTAERFRPDPFGSPGSRMYATGDRARRRHDGSLDLFGRDDDQVKLRGFRIELGEIEARIAAEAGVGQVAVVLRGDPGAERLIAYVTPRDHGRLDVDALRAAVRRALPHYMVPAVFVVLDDLPRSPAGKIDRRALPDAGPSPAESSEAAPSTELEARLARGAPRSGLRRGARP
jgi:amino acid adenylation domain-containing protein